MKNMSLGVFTSVVLVAFSLSSSVVSAQSAIRGNYPQQPVSIKTATAPTKKGVPLVVIDGIRINGLPLVGGESYKIGDTVSITWDVRGLNSSNNSIGLAVYQKSLGAKKSVISRTVGNPVTGEGVSGTGSYSWKISTSTPVGNDYVVYLSTVNGWKESIPFTVSPIMATVPTVRVLSPNGGEIYQVGEKVSVTWGSTGLSTSTPVQIVVVDTRQPGDFARSNHQIALVPNTGKYSWSIPARYGEMVFGTSSEYKIFVRSSKNLSFGAYEDGSDASFMVVASSNPLYSNARADFSPVGTSTVTQTSSRRGNSATTTVFAGFNVHVQAINGNISFSGDTAFRNASSSPFTFALYKNGVKTNLPVKHVLFAIPLQPTVATTSLRFTLPQDSAIDIPLQVIFVSTGKSTDIYSVNIETVGYFTQDEGFKILPLGTSTPSIWSAVNVGRLSYLNRQVANVFSGIEGLARFIGILR